MKDAQNKLSKRNGDASYQDLVAKGYLTEAVLNYICLLGWSPKGEYAEQESSSLARPAPIVGRVCMDSCMIDVTDIPGVEEGDEVVIFSAVPGNTPEDMARVLDTIPYEVMTSVSGRVKRIYSKE